MPCNNDSSGWYRPVVEGSEERRNAGLQRQPRYCRETLGDLPGLTATVAKPDVDHLYLFRSSLAIVACNIFCSPSPTPATPVLVTCTTPLVVRVLKVVSKAIALKQGGTYIGPAMENVITNMCLQGMGTGLSPLEESQLDAKLAFLSSRL